MLAQLLDNMHISQADFARGAGFSKAAANRLVKSGEWPARKREEARVCVTAFLTEKGANVQQLKFLETEKISLGTATNSAKAQSISTQEETLDKKDIDMLLTFQRLEQPTLKHFKLLRSPFQDDVNESADVFKSAETRYISAQIEDAARRHSFFAIVGESGAGKSTIARELEERLKNDHVVKIIRPHILAMEPNDIKGKTLRSTQLAETIIRTLNPDAKIKRNPDAKFEQAEQLLRYSSRAGHKHIILIEEAHCLPRPTLKHLKRFNEMFDGHQRLIGVMLVAQPELLDVLTSNNEEVREIAQRCEIFQLSPLDGDLKAYLQHKFTRVAALGTKLEDIMDDAAIDAIRARLTSVSRRRGNTSAVSMCYPLVVNNLVSRAMSAAAATFEDRVTADVIAKC